jgi:hypothetical protein
MVTISNYLVRQNKEGKSFIALELTGDIEMIQSANTGRFYATAKRCTVSSIFPVEIAKNLIGKQLQGGIHRVQCDPYDFTVKETGEVLSLTHTYVYAPDEKQQTDKETPSKMLMGA